MSLADLLKLAARWWWILLLFPITSATTAYAVSLSITPEYEANATLLVEESQTLGTSTYNDILANERRAQTYVRLIGTRQVADATVERLDLPISTDDLLAKLSASSIRDTQLISIRVTDTDPETAALIATTVGEVFVDQLREQASIPVDDARRELQQNLDRIRERIEETLARIDELQMRPDATSAANQAEILANQSQLNQLQSTYATLLESQQRMDIGQAQAQASVRIVDQAVPPRSPVSPRIPLNTVLGGMLGLIVAGGLVLLLGYINDAIQTSDDLSRVVGQTAVGEIPALSNAQEIVARRDQRTAPVDAFRSLRTNLQFASLGGDIRSLVVTSLRPGEGKTTVLANLATVIAQGGHRVVLVDADLRRPRIHQLFEISNRAGLTNLLLAGLDDIDSFVIHTDVPNLDVIPSGPLPPNPADVLQSAAMRELIEALESRADIVLVDSPPLAFSDPLITANIVDGTLLIVLSRKTRPDELVAGLEALSRTGTPLLGIVINRSRNIAASSAHYRSYYDEGAWPDDDGTSRTPTSRQRNRRGFPTFRARGQPRLE
ncbi:MAG TPA: polysaccharide biosynthesis tyrosine autokinase [Thermomicrobiales bacterium]|nr:polysaccharide biosynthesis tyrosine autokinase [Thermomicrobiales bacterium]